MNQHFKTVLIALCTLLTFGLARAEEENAISGSEKKLEQLFEKAIDGYTNGYSTPMRIIGSEGNSSVDIGIDTIRYIRKGADGAQGEVSFDAHVDLQIPFAIEDDKESTKIKFSGENLNLAGTGSSTLHLETGLPPVTILKDKVSLQLGEDSYVRFNCNGEEAIGLSGAFIFDEKFIQPAGKDSKVPVKAEFRVEVGDWDNLMFEATFNQPFQITGGGGYTFTVKKVVVDFSTQENVPNFTFPAGYETGFTDGTGELWTGFALKEITVAPPAEIDSLDNGGKRDFTYQISDMLIDEHGLTGAFLATRTPNEGGKNSGLNLSVDTIGVTISQNHITGGILGGSANVPFLKDKKTSQPLHLGITGQVQYDKTEKKLLYRLSGTALNAQRYGVPFTDTDMADIVLAQGCSFTIGNMNGQKKFGATLLLNGSLEINTDLKLKGIRFEGLALSTLDPHFDWKYFGLTGEINPKFAGFSLSLTKLGLSKDGNDKATLDVAAKIALMGDDMSIGAGAGFHINAAYEQEKWKFKGLVVDSIGLNIDYSAFRFRGYIKRYDENGMYGDGFKGGIELEIKPIGIGVEANIQFGKTTYNRNGAAYNEPFKYWYFDITANIPGIVIFPPAVTLTSITGGAYQRMSNSLCAGGEKEPKKMSVDDIEKKPAYIPDKETKFGFMGGVGASIVTEELINIKVLMEMAFSTHGGLKYISLKGLGSFLSKDVEKGMVRAGVFCYYNKEDEIFSLQTAVDVNFVEVVKGHGNFEIYSSPKTWYCNVGTWDDPNRLEFIGLVKVSSYFMTPLSDKVLALFGAEGYSNAGEASLEKIKGEGFAFGIALGADCGFGQKKGGIDALVNFDPHCNRKPDAKWRTKGRLYFYMDGAAGVRVRKKKHKIISLTGAASLEAEMPAPYFFEGKISFKYKILFIKGEVKKKYSKGKRC